MTASHQSSVACSRLIGKQLTLEAIRRDLDLFYFAPSPLHLIYSHFPDPEHPEWQLLPKPYSVEQFVALVPLKSAFFHRYNLEAVTHNTAEVVVGPEVELRLVFPRCRRGRVAFTFSLAADSDDKQKFSNYGVLNIVHSVLDYSRTSGLTVQRGCVCTGISELIDSEVIFRLRFPEPRAYTFQVFAKNVDPARLAAPVDKLQSV